MPAISQSQIVTQIERPYSLIFLFQESSVGLQPTTSFCPQYFQNFLSFMIFIQCNAHSLSLNLTLSLSCYHHDFLLATNQILIFFFAICILILSSLACLVQQINSITKLIYFSLLSLMNQVLLMPSNPFYLGQQHEKLCSPRPEVS